MASQRSTGRSQPTFFSDIRCRRYGFFDVFTRIPFHSHVCCAQGFVPLVKSADRTRIVSNANVFDFELDSTEITELDQLDECTYRLLFPRSAHLQLIPSTKDLVTDWDPTDCP
jgi:hypothetical protein